MKKETIEQLEQCQKSIDWWREQSEKLFKESNQMEKDHAFGAITDDEMVEKARVLDDKMAYLEKKGLFEQKQMYFILSGASNE